MMMNVKIVKDSGKIKAIGEKFWGVNDLIYNSRDKKGKYEIGLLPTEVVMIFLKNGQTICTTDCNINGGCDDGYTCQWHDEEIIAYRLIELAER